MILVSRRFPIAAVALSTALLALFTVGAVGQSDEQPTPTDAPWVEVKKGLEIRDLEIGDGEEVRRGSRFTARYAGWLEDGTLFDSNRKGATQVMQLGVGQVIKGWDLGLVGMKIGGVRQLRVPPKLGYGKRGVPGKPGQPPRIPKDATLLFEVEILAVM